MVFRLTAEQLERFRGNTNPRRLPWQAANDLVARCRTWTPDDFRLYEEITAEYCDNHRPLEAAGTTPQERRLEVQLLKTALMFFAWDWDELFDFSRDPLSFHSSDGSDDEPYQVQRIKVQLERLEVFNTYPRMATVLRDTHVKAYRIAGMNRMDDELNKKYAIARELEDFSKLSIWSSTDLDELIAISAHILADVRRQLPARCSCREPSDMVIILDKNGGALGCSSEDS